MTLPWPPPYQIRQSLRAKSVRLKICVNRGLEVVVPHRLRRFDVTSLLQQHKIWIEDTWHRIHANAPLTTKIDLPTQITFSAINETWQIQYQATDSPNIRLAKIDKYLLILYGDVNNHQKVSEVLLKWMCRYAKVHLTPWLTRLSQQTNLHFTKLTIRNANTRWGSCSSKNAISLNCKLLFLPSELVEHVLLHELCHTVQHNHSKRFWDLLKSVSTHADCHQLRKQLKQANQFVPAWVEI